MRDVSPSGAPLRVGVDGSALLRPGTGIGGYTAELLRALLHLPDAPELRVLVNAFRSGGAVPTELAPCVTNPHLPDRVLRFLWERLGRPGADTLLGGVEVFHTSDWRQPPLARAARVTTVHDVGALDRPAWYAADVAALHRRQNEATARLADRIVAVSAFTRDRLVERLGVAPERVAVVPNGVSARFRPVAREEARAVARSHGLEPPYVLYVGTRERRKNLLGLVDAFRRVADTHPDVTLALVGMRPWREGAGVHGAGEWSGREVEERIGWLGLEGRVRVPGWLPPDDLPAVYAAAEVLAFPTLYEGFGLPVLEAMACGLPVVASDRTAVPEVVGDAGLVADPEDADAFALALARVLDDGGLGETLREKGLARAAAFSWRRTAEGTRAAYREALAERRGGSP